MNRWKRYISVWHRYWRSRGFGIHSPFAYNFVTNVMRQSYSYYAYESISYLHATIRESVRHAGGSKKVMSERSARLLFRVVNYFNPRNVLQIGSNYGLSAASTLMVNSRIRLWLYDPYNVDGESTQSVLKQFASRIISVRSIVNAVTDYPASLGDDEHPFVTINSISHVDSYSQLQYFVNSVLDRKGVIVFRNIANDRLMRQMWEESRQYAQHGMSFSNDRLAVFVADPGLPRQDFLLWL